MKNHIADHMSKKNSILYGKRVLLIATSFFGYETEMKNSFERLGASVKYYDERSIKSQWEKAIIKISPEIVKRKTRRYYANIIQECKNDIFDYLYIYGATMIDKEIIEMITNGIIVEKTILYLVDSVIGSKRYEDIFPYFDVIATFDRKDYEYYKGKYKRVKLLPLFYSPNYIRNENEDCQVEYDVSFVGTIHSDRLKFLEQIKKQLDTWGLTTNYYCYLPSRFMFYFYYITKPEFRNKKKTDFAYKKLTSKEIAGIMQKSRCILDAQYPKNTGLTMRTFETLGMRRKLITTNKDVTNYDFYNESNILVVDRDSPELSKDFFAIEYKDIPEKIYSKYYIDHWSEDLFS